MRSVTAPLSILDMSSTSLISPNRCSLDVCSLSIYACSFSGLFRSCCIRFVKPMMAFMGVRMSWLIFVRNAVLDTLADSASFSASTAA